MSPSILNINGFRIHTDSNVCTHLCCQKDFTFTVVTWEADLFLLKCGSLPDLPPNGDIAPCWQADPSLPAPHTSTRPDLKGSTIMDSNMYGIPLHQGFTI